MWLKLLVAQHRGQQGGQRHSAGFLWNRPRSRNGQTAPSRKRQPIAELEI